MHLIFNYYYCIPAIFISVLGSGGAGSARAAPKFGGLEKRTERETDYLLMMSSSWNFSAQIKPSYEDYEPSRVELKLS